MLRIIKNIGELLVPVALLVVAAAPVPAFTQTNDDLIGDMDFASPLSLKKSEQYSGQMSTSDRHAIETLCHGLANKMDVLSFADCAESGIRPSLHVSAEGRPLVKADVAPFIETKKSPRIMLIGGQHGDELSSIKLVFKWLNQLNQSPSTDTRWRVLPAANPDGTLQVPATRTNANGIDLNRNLPTPNWVIQSHKYWVAKGQHSRFYPGEKAASEPESIWLLEEIADFQPDIIISVHAPLGLFDFDAGDLSKAPKTLGPLNLFLLGTFPGSLGNYAGITRNVPVITIELAHSYELPTVAEVNDMWGDLQAWLGDKSTGGNYASSDCCKFDSPTQ